MSLNSMSAPKIQRQKESPELYRTNARTVIAGVAIDSLSMEEASMQIVEAMLQPSPAAPFLIMGPNAQLITLAQKNSRFSEALQASAFNVPDGISTVLASKILGGNISRRVPGGELMEQLCGDLAGQGLSIFLLGGLPGAAAEAAQRLQRRFPALSIAGTYCPPPGFEHNPMERAHIRQLVAEAAPDLLFVAFGAPKQEIWMHENCSTLPIRGAMSVGAAFDTLSGLRRRAPRWTHKLGLEWLYRLVREPRRLWRRYLIGNTHFLYLVFRQRVLSGYQSGSEENLRFVWPTPSSTQPTGDPLTVEQQA